MTKSDSLRCKSTKNPGQFRFVRRILRQLLRSVFDSGFGQESRTNDAESIVGSGAILVGDERGVELLNGESELGGIGWLILGVERREGEECT